VGRDGSSAAVRTVRVRMDFGIFMILRSLFVKYLETNVLGGVDRMFRR
jgi:hypothetical protein